jgi:hypothetical protein
MKVSTYTQLMYMRGKVEKVDHDQIVAHFALRMRSLCIRGDVSLMNIPTYTQATYTRGIAESINYNRIYKSILTSLSTLKSAQY